VNDVTVTICYLISNGNDVTVTVWGKDAHLWIAATPTSVSDTVFRLRRPEIWALYLSISGFVFLYSPIYKYY
jgi:hypothetical protein